MVRQSSYIRYWDRLRTGFLLLYRPWSVVDGKESKVRDLTRLRPQSGSCMCISAHASQIEERCHQRVQYHRKKGKHEIYGVHLTLTERSFQDLRRQAIQFQESRGGHWEVEGGKYSTRNWQMSGL